MLSFDDLELTGNDKIEADLQFKELLANMAKENDAKQKLDSERFSRELTETSERLYNQQRQYKDMMIDVHAEAIQRAEAEKKKPKPVKEKKKPVNEQRNDDFAQWINESKPDLDGMTKKQVQQELIKRNSRLWQYDFDGWIKYTKLYEGKSGRPKTA